MNGSNSSFSTFKFDIYVYKEINLMDRSPYKDLLHMCCRLPGNLKLLGQIFMGCLFFCFFKDLQ